MLFSIALGFLYSFKIWATWADNIIKLSPIWLIGILFWLLPLFWVITYRGKTPWLLRSPHLQALIGFVVLLPAYLGLITLHGIGYYLIILLFVIIWSSDTFAYFVGRQWGKNPLAPYVSPKKTWAGFWGGLIGASIVAYLMAPHGSNFMYGVIVATILLGVLGDLFESLLKRIAGVKDSGTLLPGHGGILDRIDSLIAALPMYSFALVALNA